MARHTVHTLDQRSLAKLKRDHRQITTQPTHQVVSQPQRTWDHIPLPGYPVQYFFDGFVHSLYGGAANLGSSEAGPSTVALNAASIRGSEDRAKCHRLEVSAIGKPCVRLTRGIWSAKLSTQWTRTYLDPKVWPLSGTDRDNVMLNRLRGLYDYNVSGSPYATSGIGPTSGPFDDDNGWVAGGDGNHQHGVLTRNRTNYPVDTHVVVTGGDSETELVDAYTGSLPDLSVPTGYTDHREGLVGSGGFRIDAEFLIEADSSQYDVVVVATPRAPASTAVYRRELVAVCDTSASSITFRRLSPIL